MTVNYHFPDYMSAYQQSVICGILSSAGLSVLLFILLQQWLSAANCAAVFAAPHCGLDVAVLLG